MQSNDSSNRAVHKKHWISFATWTLKHVVQFHSEEWWKTWTIGQIVFGNSWHDYCKQFEADSLEHQWHESRTSPAFTNPKSKGEQIAQLCSHVWQWRSPRVYQISVWQNGPIRAIQMLFSKFLRVNNHVLSAIKTTSWINSIIIEARVRFSIHMHDRRLNWAE